MPSDRNETCPTTQRFAVFRGPENPPDSWRSWSAYTRDFNTAWPSFVGFYEGHGATRRERQADAIKRARIDNREPMGGIDRTAPTPAPREECVCGDRSAKGVVHRTDGPCFHRPLPDMTKDPLAPEDHARLAASDPGPSAPRDATPTDGEVVVWHYDDRSWREAFHDDGKTSPLTKHIAIPAAQRERERAVIEAAGSLTGALAWVEREIAALTERMEPIGPDRVGYKDRDRYNFWCWIKNHHDRLKTVRGHLLAIQRQRAEAEFLRADEKYAALRRGERKED